MKDIAGFAHGVVARASKMAGHTDEDWTILAAVKNTTTPWAGEMTRSFGKRVYAEEMAVEVMGDRDRREWELSLGVWYEKLVSGEPSEAWWPETALVGFFHASAGVPNEMILAMGGHIEQFFLDKCLENLDAAEAAKVYGAFHRIMSVSISLMVESYHEAVVTGVQQLGFNKKLMNRMRTVAIKKMIDQGRDSLPMMTWDASLSVGVDEVDRQHQVLIDLLNRLHVAHTAGKGNTEVGDVLNELNNYTIEHFAWEENMLKEKGYPQLPAHIAAHIKLKATVQSFVDGFAAGKGGIGAEMFLFLRSWLNGHIRGNDRHYGNYLAGLK